MRQNGRFPSISCIFDWLVMSEVIQFFRYSSSKNFISLKVNSCNRFLTPALFNYMLNFQSIMTHVFTFFSLEPEIQLVRNGQFSVKKLFLKQLQRQSSQFRNLHEIAKTSSKRFQIFNIVCMPIFVCTIG